MTDAEMRVSQFLLSIQVRSPRTTKALATVHAGGFEAVLLKDIKQILEDLAEQRMLCDLYRKEALGRAGSNAAEHMAQHDLT